MNSAINKCSGYLLHNFAGTHHIGQHSPESIFMEDQLTSTQHSSHTCHMDGCTH